MWDMVLFYAICYLKRFCVVCICGREICFLNNIIKFFGNQEREMMGSVLIEEEAEYEGSSYIDNTNNQGYSVVLRPKKVQRIPSIVKKDIHIGKVVYVPAIETQFKTIK